VNEALTVADAWWCVTKATPGALPPLLLLLLR